ncbi:unnamed protein product [Rhizoctonia solani]|uniref:Uncharacterized protein n=1 Tax=Rhizoctonia solani TaxID=456999 RepID=A0A8H3H5N1_9AGAM|nr:unnamed protein product [Rhizoctonia solani]
MATHYEPVPLQVPLPQLSKHDFELKVEGVDPVNQSPLRGYLGIEPCTWPVTAIFTPTKGSIDIRWIELKAQVYERAYTTYIADIEEVSQVLFQSTAIVFGTEETPSYETVTGPRVLSHVFNVPSHMPSALQSKHNRRAQVIWKIVFKVYRKSGAFKQYVVASSEPNVLLDTLYRHKIGNQSESNEGCSFEFDVIVPGKSSPDYTGTFMSVTHRLQLTMVWKGRLLDKVISHPIAIAALSHSERQRAIEEVAQTETTPSIAPPSQNDDVPPPAYVSTQPLPNESSTAFMPDSESVENELPPISYRSSIGTPTPSRIALGIAT